jgi:hypothetical protein
VAAASVWLALHASREAALAKRLEEDYKPTPQIELALRPGWLDMRDVICGD